MGCLHEKLKILIKALKLSKQSNSEAILFRGASGTLSLKVVASGLAFLLNLVLARIFGTEGYGAYAYALAWVTVLLVPAKLGCDQLIVREVATFISRSEWNLLKGILRSFKIGILLASIFLVIAAVGICVFLKRSSINDVLPLIIMLIALPFLSMNGLYFAVLRAVNKVVIGQVPEMVVKPILLMTLSVLAYFSYDRSVTSNDLSFFFLITSAVTFYFLYVMAKRALPGDIIGIESSYNFPIWVRSAIPFLLVGGIRIINTNVDIIMLGTLAGQDAAGIYNIARRGAELLAFVLIAFDLSLAPLIPPIYQKGDMKQLQAIVTKEIRSAFYLSLPLALFFLLFGGWFMGLFGTDFIEGTGALTVLCVARLLYIAVGSAGVILNMTGNEKLTAAGIAIGAVVNVILNAILVPRYGATGAATATAASMLVWNCFHCICLIKKLGINPMVLHFSLSRSIK